MIRRPYLPPASRRAKGKRQSSKAMALEDRCSFPLDGEFVVSTIWSGVYYILTTTFIRIIWIIFF